MSDDQLPDPAHLGYIPIPVPDMDRLMELRDALVALKGPLANDPGWRENLHKRLFNADTAEQVLGKLSSALS
ncbi:type VI secretion system contractile sheath small subunit [Pseudomonas sp. ADAK18]|uniref:type VI secretion system contractile sheath small subunit n=1 Tax=Pseudomonas sp. ADAK18 TaxID=2730848 RepID=UPI003014E887